MVQHGIEFTRDITKINMSIDSLIKISHQIYSSLHLLPYLFIFLILFIYITHTLPNIRCCHIFAYWLTWCHNYYINNYL